VIAHQAVGVAFPVEGLTHFVENWQKGARPDPVTLF